MGAYLFFMFYVRNFYRHLLTINIFGIIYETYIISSSSFFLSELLPYTKVIYIQHLTIFSRGSIPL